MSTHSLARMIHSVKSALLVSDEGLGRLVGAARKTVGKWGAGRSTPSYNCVARMAELVKPKDAALALALVRAHNAHVTSLRLPAHALPEEPYLPPRTKRGDVRFVDAVVCAACDAADAPPKLIRQALRAAFERALALDLDVELLATALAPARATRPSR